MNNEAPKSAIELAMERLRRKDEETGASESVLSDEQKAAIAEARRVHAAGLAQVEILHSSKMAAVWQPEERHKLEAEYRRDVSHLNDDRDRKIERIRNAGR
ncbi:MAG: hypothetical protein ABR606_12665 [Vicinamibacterales bacterium]